MHPAALPIGRLLDEVELSAHRAGGPGGQRRNKVETAVRATHRPSGLSASASERRSREHNRVQALRRLRLVLALQHREPVDLAQYGPSRLWTGRVQGGRLMLAAGHEDVPALLAEALDVIAALDDDLAIAAGLLGVTPSRLVRLLRRVPRALADLNERLVARGRRRWR